MFLSPGFLSLEFLSPGRRAALHGLLLTALWASAAALGFHPVYAQQHIQLRNLETGEQIRRSFPQGADVTIPTAAGGSQAARGVADNALGRAVARSPRDTVRLIVELEAEPVLQRQARLQKRGAPPKSIKSQLRTQRSRVEQGIGRLRSDLQGMTPPQGEAAPSEDAPGKAAAPGPKARITEEYTDVLSGAAVTTRRWAVGEIRSLPYVEETHFDRRAEKTVSDARRVVGADELGAEGTTGEGVTIAILDTGIDYTHPALGGDIGPGSKVTGGYDLVNDDPDPMDGDGHGTHVAGIAAANGEGPGGEEITGVAPEAKLRAYKVLNDQGSGSFSTIIAGIERAVEDSVDIINMSLGGPGTPDGPLAQATDNASKAGALPTVSAGNGGDYRTIGSPGVADRALTVGASNDDDRITDFSSRGPTNGAFTVKPDVVAPGARVRSTLPGGSFGRLSGTSMAAPVVAGAAALALGRNPGWNAQFLKGALMKSGVDIGEDIWTQGQGRIDAPTAAEARVVATPGILSFGLVDNEEDTWTRTDTLKLRNRGESGRTYQLSVESGPSGLAPGVSVNLQALSVTVAAKDSALVPVTAEVSNGVASFPEGTPPSFTGQVRAAASRDTITVPYGMVKAPTVALSLGEEESAIVLAHRSNGETAFFGGVQDGRTLLLPETGEYDFIARIPGFGEPDTYVVKEGVPATETSTLDVGPGQAQHTISMDFRTGDGEEVPLIPDGEVLLTHESGAGIFTFGAGGLQEEGARFSSMSDEYLFRGMSVGHAFEDGRSKDYRVPYQFRGLSGDKTLSSDPSDFQSVTYRLTDEVADRAFFSHLTHRVVGRSLLSYWGSTNGIPAEEVEAPVVRELNVLPRPKETYGSFSDPVASYDWYPAYRVLDYSDVTLASETSSPVEFDPSPIYQTGVPQPSGPDTTAFYRAFDFEEPIRRSATDLGPIGIGGHPPRWEADAAPGGVLQSGIDSGWFEGPFAGVKLGGPVSEGTIQYRRYKDGALVEEDVLANSGNFVNAEGLGRRSLRNFEPGDSLVARLPHPAGGRDGDVELRFAPGTGDLSPRIDRFEIRSGGQVRDTLASSRANLVRASFEDKSAVDSVEAFVRLAGEEAERSSWTKVGSAEGGSLAAKVPSTLETGHYALRVRGSGEEGGRVEQVADPAFWFGQREKGAPDPPASLAAASTLGSISLEWSSPFASDVASYRIYRSAAPIDSSTGLSELGAIDTLSAGDTQYTDPTAQAEETYYYRVTAVDEGGLESSFSGEVEATVRQPALSLEDFQIDFESPGNGDGKAQAGEFLFVDLALENKSDSTFGSDTRALVDSSADPHVHPIGGYRFTEEVRAFQTLPPGEITELRQSLQFHVAGSAPVGHELTVPMRFLSEDGHVVGRDTVEVEVEGPDVTPPEISGLNVDVQPGYVEPGEETTIAAFVEEGHREVSVEAIITQKETGEQVGTVGLRDDGTGPDEEAGDRVFSASFSPKEESEYAVDISATDEPGNTGTFEGASFTSEPFPEEGEVMVVANDGRPWRDDRQSEYAGAAEGAGLSADVWNVYRRGTPPLQRLKRFGVAMWYGNFDLRGEERRRIASYLGSGGSLLISDGDLARALNFRAPAWMEETLRAEFVQDNVQRYSAIGREEDPVGRGLEIPLGRRGRSADELDPAGSGAVAFEYDESATEPQASAEAGTEEPAREMSASVGEMSAGKSLSATERPCAWRPVGQDTVQYMPGCAGDETGGEGQFQKQNQPRLEDATRRDAAREGATKRGVTETVDSRTGPASGENSGIQPNDIESSGTAGIRFSEGSQRLLFLSFGLEAISSDERRDRLTSRAIQWLTALPSPPRALTGEPAEREVELSWAPSEARDVEKYRIYRSSTPIDSAAGPSGVAALDSTAAGDTTYVDTSVEVGTEYRYRVTAVDTSGNESSFSCGASAAPQEGALVSVQNQAAVPGSEADVPVRVDRLGQVGSISLVLSYDPDALSFSTGSSSEDLKTEDLISNSIREGFSATRPEPGELRISWFDQTGANPINLQEGTLLEVTFDEFSGDSTRVAFQPNSELASADGSPVGVAFEDGIVATASEATVSGTVTYPGEGENGLTDGRPLSGVPVELVSAASGEQAARDTTGSGGTFSATVSDGEYVVRAQPGEVLDVPNSEINATDAIRTVGAFSGTAPLTGAFHREIADVTDNGLINATDALRMALFFSNPSETTFEAGTWATAPDTVKVAAGGAAVENDTEADTSSSDASAVVRAAAYGDANLSGGEKVGGGGGTAVTTTARDRPSSIASTSGMSGGGASSNSSQNGKTPAPGQESSPSVAQAGETFKVPVRIGSEAALGAYSLQIEFDTEKAFFEGTVRGDTPVGEAGESKGTETEDGESVTSAAENGLVRLSWFDQSGEAPMRLDAGSVLVTLQFRVARGVEENADFTPEITGGELAGPEAEPLSNANLLAREIEIGPKLPEEFALHGSYPNPTRSQATVEMDLPSKATVTVSVYNVLGQRVQTKKRQVSAGAERSIALDVSSVASGQYFYQVKADLEERSVQKSGRITVVR